LRIRNAAATITGSIGSISGRFNIKGLHDKLGITHDFVQTLDLIAREPGLVLQESYVP
jgi:ClpP class serine protease